MTERVREKYPRPLEADGGDYIKLFSLHHKMLTGRDVPVSPKVKVRPKPVS